MRTRRFLILCMAVIAGAGALKARKNHENWLDQPFTKWNQKQVGTLLDKSAWAQTKSFRGQVRGEHGSFNPGTTGTPGTGTLGIDVQDYSFTARLFSAQPIREAYVRMLQIVNHYDTMPPQRQQEFDAKVDGLLHADVSQEVVVTLSYQTNDPVGKRNLDQWFNTQTADTLRQSAYLYTSGAGQVQLLKYFPPQNGGGLGARFIFPRTFKNEPILQPGAERLRFEIYVPAIGQEMYVDFKPAEMEYKGQFCY